MRLYRKEQNRKPSPSSAIVDSQSVKNSEWGLLDKGFDGHKKIQGRKRHIAVDTLGLVLAVLVTPANMHDSKAALNLLVILKNQGYRRMKTIICDQAYKGLHDMLQTTFNWILQITFGAIGQGFQVLPQRWKVERTIAWLHWSRRLAKDYEANTSSSQAFVYLANINYIIRKF